MRGRRLPAGLHAFSALAHLRGGDTYAQCAAGFGIGVATVHRYAREAAEVLAALASTLDEVITAGREKVYLILDVPRAADRPDRCRPAVPLREEEAVRHERAGPDRSLRPPAICLARTARRPHELTAARDHDIIDVLAVAGLTAYADKAYQGASRPIRVPSEGTASHGGTTPPTPGSAV